MDLNFSAITLAIIACGIIAVVIRRRKKNKETTDFALLEGRFTTGRIISVKSPAGSEPDRRSSDIQALLEYREPTTGEVRIVRHELDQKTPNMPPCIAAAHARGLAGDPDDNGYLPLTEPVHVDVYLQVHGPMRNGIHLVFKKQFIG